MVKAGGLLLAIEIVGGRSALEVYGGIGDQWNAGRGGDGVELELKLVDFQLLLDRVDDAVAQIRGVADDLLIVVVIGTRHRRLAIAERDRAGVLDLLERAGQLLGACRCTTQSRGSQRRRRDR